MRLLKQSTARSIVVFMTDSTDHVTGKTGLTLTITASKDGAAFEAITPTVTELATGWYKLALTTAHTDTLGDLALHITSAGADPTDTLMQVVTDLPGVAQTGDNFARLGAPAGASIAADIAGVQSDTNDIQTRIPAALVGGRMDADVGNVTATGDLADAVWNAATATYGGAGSYGALVETNLDAAVSTRLATAGYTAPLDAAGTRSAIGLAAANLDTQLTAIDDYLDTEVAAIKAKTDNLPASPAATSDIPSAATIATEVMTSAQTTPIHADIKKVTGVTINGSGTAGSPWGP